MPKIPLFLLFFSIISNILGKTEDLVAEDLLKYEANEYINFFKVPKSLISSTTKEPKKKSYFNKFISFLSFNHPTLYTTHFFKFEETIKANRIVFNWLSEEKCIPTKENIRILYSIEDSDMKQIDEFTYNRIGKKSVILMEKEMEVESIQIEIKFAEELCRDEIEKSNIEILQPETDKLNSNIINIFDKSDYRMLTLSKEYNNKEFVATLEEESRKYKLSDYAERYINRIKAVISEEKTYDPRREFTTNLNNQYNIIHQRGDIKSYAGNTLKMYFAGTNRQSTGIYARSNETITIFAKRGKNDDPLPSLICT